MGGKPGSPFSCVAGAVLLGVRGAIFGAIAAAVCLGALSVAFVSGVLRPPSDQTAYGTSWDAISYPLTLNLLVLLVVFAVFGGLGVYLYQNRTHSDYTKGDPSVTSPTKPSLVDPIMGDPGDFQLAPVHPQPAVRRRRRCFCPPIRPCHPPGSQLYHPRRRPEPPVVRRHRPRPTPRAEAASPRRPCRSRTSRWRPPT